MLALSLPIFYPHRGDLMTPTVRVIWGEGAWLYNSIVGIIFIIIGCIWKVHCVTLGVAGASKECVLWGDKKTINALIELVNKRRFPANNSDI